MLPLRLIAWAFIAMALDIGVARITYGTVLPALRRDLGLSFFEGGALSAVNLAAYLVGTLVAPSLARHVSMRALARWGHAIFALGALLSSAAPEIVTFALGRILMGAGAGVGLLALFVVVFERTRPDLRSVASVAVWSGIGIAIVASGLAAPSLLGEAGRWRWAFGLSAVLAVLVTWEVGRTPSGAAPTTPSPPGGRAAATAMDSSGLAWAGLFGAYLMFGVGYIAYATFVGGRLAAAGAAMGTVVWSWVVFGLGSIAGSIVGAGVLSSLRWKGYALLLALLSGAAGSAAAIQSGNSGPLIGALLVGLGLASTPAIVTAFVRERTRDADYARLFSLATASLGIGQLAGPVIAGALADLFGPDAVLVFAAGAYLCGAIFATGDLLRFRTGGR